MSSTWSSFVPLYGEEPLPAWVHALKDHTDEQLMRGYQKARDAGLEFPPNLSVFMDYMKDDWEAKRIHRRWNPNEAIVDKGEQALLEHNQGEPGHDSFKKRMQDIGML
jgi:hypothetical protein